MVFKIFGKRWPVAPPRMRGSGGDKRNTAADDSYAHWKLLVPVLYDWLASHNLVWPSLSCRWGPVLEQGTYKSKQRLYLSEQTDHTQPNTLIIANCKVVKPRVAAENHIARSLDSVMKSVGDLIRSCGAGACFFHFAGACLFCSG